jgi:AcrR family transcriptional regulator
MKMRAAKRSSNTRTLAQRERILNAAQECFIRSGFHAASMAEIAQAANMSAGLIYRYFENKNAIVQAITARQLEEGMRTIEQINTVDDLLAALLHVFERWQRGDDPDKNAAQFLDVTAAAARDDEIAAMVHASSAQFARQLREACKRIAAADGATPDTAELAGRVLLLQSLVCGLAAQSIRDPSIKLSNLETALRQFLRHLLRE